MIASELSGSKRGRSESIRAIDLVIARYAEPAFKFAAAKLGGSDRPAFSDTFDPAALKVWKLDFSFNYLLQELAQGCFG
jgi:hypothetical protein